MGNMGCLPSLITIVNAVSTVVCRTGFTRTLWLMLPAKATRPQAISKLLGGVMLYLDMYLSVLECPLPSCFAFLLLTPNILESSASTISIHLPLPGKLRS